MDAPGNFLRFLYPYSSIYAYEIDGRFDIGGLDTYIEAEEAFTKLKK
jgi:hypothetical protein